MSRLTKDGKILYKGSSWKAVFGPNVNPEAKLITENIDKALEKLSCLEDVDEELDCRLNDYILLLKALKQGYVYVPVNNFGSYGEKINDDIKKMHVRLENIGGEICLALLHNSMWKGIETVATIGYESYKTLFWLKEDKSE